MANSPGISEILKDCAFRKSQ
uniref:Uncharacterized protein n=1 Tax=Anguilla anguilla TaxID=7936 RepID=A0A0E9T5Z7_ANGAN